MGLAQTRQVCLLFYWQSSIKSRWEAGLFSFFIVATRVFCLRQNAYIIVVIKYLVRVVQGFLGA